MDGIGKDECQDCGHHRAEGRHCRAPCKYSCKSLSGKHIRIMRQGNASLVLKGFTQKKQDGNQQEYQENTGNQRVNALNLPFFHSLHCQTSHHLPVSLPA